LHCVLDISKFVTNLQLKSVPVIDLSVLNLKLDFVVVFVIWGANNIDVLYVTPIIFVLWVGYWGVI
jgi:hypothetical protein